MGLAVVAALVTKMIPDLVQSMITGQTGVGNHVGGMATTVLAASAAATGVGLAGSAMAAGGGGGAAATLGGGGSGPVAGGVGIAQAMNASMIPRAGLTPGLGSAGAGGPGGLGAPAGGRVSSMGSGMIGTRRNAAFRTVGTMAELVVPGMEGASAIGVAPQPGPMPNLESESDTEPPSEAGTALTATPVASSQPPPK